MEKLDHAIWGNTFLKIFRVLGYGPMASPEMDSLQNRANAVWDGLRDLQRPFQI